MVDNSINRNRYRTGGENMANVGRPKSENPAAAIVNVRLTAGELTALDTYCATVGKTRADVIRDALRAITGNTHTTDAAERGNRRA